MANEKSQPLKAFEDIKKRKEDPKTEKAFIKEAIKSKYSRKEPPMKSGGRAGFKGGSDMSKKPATVEAIRKAEKRMKAASEVSKNQGRSFTNIQREKHMR